MEIAEKSDDFWLEGRGFLKGGAEAERIKSETTRRSLRMMCDWHKAERRECWLGGQGR
jgi:hypothetical protein